MLYLLKIFLSLGICGTFLTIYFCWFTENRRAASVLGLITATAFMVAIIIAIWTGAFPICEH